MLHDFYNTSRTASLKWWMGVLCLCLFSCQTPTDISQEYGSEQERRVQNTLAFVSDATQKRQDRTDSLESVLDRMHRVKPGDWNIDTYSKIASRCYQLRRMSSFKKVSQMMVRISEEKNDSLGLARGYFNLGGYYYFGKERVDSAYANYFKAQNIFARIDSSKMAGRALLSMAIMQKNVKDYVGGESNTIEAIKHFEKAQDLRYLASSNNNMGVIAKDIQQYDRAIEYHKKALEYRKGLVDKPWLVVSSLSNIGLVYANKGDYEEAVRYYEQGLNFDSLYYKRPRTYARLLDNLAFAKFKKGETDGFPEALFTPLRMRDSLRDHLGAVTSHIHLATYYHSIDNKEAALEQAELAYVGARQLQYNRGTFDAINILLEVAAPEKARIYGQRYVAISDSLQKVERSFQDQFARIRFETDALEYQNERAVQKIKMLWLFLLSLGILFLIGYIIIQRRINVRSMRFKEDQQKANEEILNLMLTQRTKLEEGKQLEKQRISEELHDGVLARLFGIRLNLDSLNLRVDEEAKQSRANFLEGLKDLGIEIRQISHDLNGHEVKMEQLYVDVVENLVKEQSGPLNYSFYNDPIIDWTIVPNATKAHMYRVVQESLQNVHKHAKASKVDVSFEQIEGKIELRITDNGRGMPEGKIKKGIGLKNIASRVRKIQGEFKVDSALGAGTTVYVQFK